HPMVGSMVARVRPPRRSGVPGYVCGVDAGRDGIDVFSFGSAYLGPQTHPFFVVGDPSAPNFQVRNLGVSPQLAGRLPDRLRLLGSFDSTPAARDHTGAMRALDTNRERALNLLTADAARTAFDLTREPRRVRERYGMHPWGQRALMARRLVEHGASIVTMVMENP